MRDNQESLSEYIESRSSYQSEIDKEKERACPRYVRCKINEIIDKEVKNGSI